MQIVLQLPFFEIMLFKTTGIMDSPAVETTGAAHFIHY